MSLEFLWNSILLSSVEDGGTEFGGVVELGVARAMVEALLGHMEEEVVSSLVSLIPYFPWSTMLTCKVAIGSVTMTR